MQPLYRDFSSQEEIDAQYDLGRILGDPARYFEFYKSASERARDTLECHLDVPFGPTREETIDIFPAPESRAPIVCFIHGGYWRRMNAKDFSFAALGLVERGITVVVTNYALCPKVTLPEITRQSRAAIAWVRRNESMSIGDRERLFVIGHSAGAHQAVRVSDTAWQADYGLPADTVRGTYAISGIFDLRPLRHSFVQPSLQLNADVIQQESPMLAMPASAPPIRAEVGQHESAEFKRQSADLIDARRGAGLRAQYAEQPGKNHFTAIDELADGSSPLCDRIVGFMGDCER